MQKTTNYIDKINQAGGAGNFNDIQIFSNKRKGIPSLKSPGGR